jgi:subtilisin family serine protease
MAKRKSQDPGGATPAGDAPDTPRAPRRYVVSHLLSVHGEGQARADAVDLFSTRVQRVLPEVNVLADSTASAGPREGAGGERRVLLVEADEADLQALMSGLTSDTVVEPELPRVPAIAYPAELLPTVHQYDVLASELAAAGATAANGPGTGSVLVLNLQDAQGGGVEGCTVIVNFVGRANPSAAVVAGGVSSGAGVVEIPFDPNLWNPVIAGIEPDGRFWSQMTRNPASGQVIRLTELPRTGPVGWWQLLSGVVGWDPAAGTGLKVGVIDTGVGPHPALAHAIPVGAFIDGGFTAGPASGLDVQNHGTHVSGIIGARPVTPDEFGGIAPGAELFVARVFTATSGANQGDIAAAIDALSGPFGVDVINMSLVGAASAIERDAVIVALQRGTVCVCAAGNQAGAVGFPAAYPESIAVSALGLVNTWAADSMPAFNVPTQPNRFGVGGTFLASFSNTGPQLQCAAPGNGIISTIPSSPGDEAPYADMSGTSMSSPLVAGILANMLSRDPVWKDIPRGVQRAIYARAALGQLAIPVLQNPLFEGRGLARV